MKRFVILTCLASLHAADSEIADLRRDGLAALGRGEWMTAAGILAHVVAATPADTDAWVLLGIARWHQGRADDALAAIDRALTGRPALEPRARYYRAIILTARGRDDEAAAEFALVAERFPASEEAIRIRAATESIPTPAAPATERRIDAAAEHIWRMDAGASLVWDGNPDRLDPDQVEDPRPDWMLDTFASLRWTGWSRRIGAMVAGRSEDYVRRDDLDALAVQGRLWFGLVSDARNELRLGGSSTRSWLGHAPFRWRHAAELGWWHGVDANLSTWFDASLASVRHDQEEDAGLDGPEYRLDLGTLWEANGPGLLQTVEGRIGGGYGNTERRDQASTQIDGMLAAGWRPASGWLIRWSGEAGLRAFGEESISVTSFSGKGGGHSQKRTDTWAGTGLSLEWQIRTWCILALHGYGERTWSNQSLYEHDLVLASGQLRLAW